MNLPPIYIFLLTVVFSEAPLTIDFRLVEYSNPASMECKDKGCYGNCDNRFLFCLRKEGDIENCDRGKTTNVYALDLIKFTSYDLSQLGISNPLRFSSISPRKMLELAVEVTNVGYIWNGKVDDIIIELDYNLKANSEYSDWKEYQGTCKKAFMKVQINITSECPPNLYGEFCDQKCTEVSGKRVCNYLGLPIFLNCTDEDQDACHNVYQKDRISRSKSRDAGHTANRHEDLDRRIGCDEHFTGDQCDTCEQHYYPEDTCNAQCMPQNDSEGHYKCNPETGNRQCLAGYEDPTTYCVIPVESESSGFLGSVGFYATVGAVILCVIVLVAAIFCAVRCCRKPSATPTHSETKPTREPMSTLPTAMVPMSALQPMGPLTGPMAPMMAAQPMEMPPPYYETEVQPSAPPMLY